MNRFDAMDMDLDAMYDDVRIDEVNLGFLLRKKGKKRYFRNLKILEGLVYMMVDF